MDLYSFLSLFGGLAFFLYGMNVLSAGLEKIAGGKMDLVLKKMTSNVVLCLLLGAGISIAMQSSSAATVMLMGLVNSDIMQLSQTIGIIIGANVGTTLTSWILSLAGIESGSVLVNMLKPANFSPIIALIGMVMLMTTKSQRKKDIGSICLGFSVLMYGMTLMSDAVSPLVDSPVFASLLTAFNNPLLGIAVGTIFTGIIQSSAASVGILQALCLTGNITYGMAIPIIMGQNIGTCATALLSSIGVNRNAKRVAVVHIGFNVIGTIILSILFFSLDAIFSFPITNRAIGAAGVAMVHTIFNVITAIMLLPFSKSLEKLAALVVPDAKGAESGVLIDQRLLNSSPSLAIAECNNFTMDMAQIAQKNVSAALAMFHNWNQKSADHIRKTEDSLDKYEDELGSVLVKLSSKTLSNSDSQTVSRLLHIIGDLERIGDHALNIEESAEEMHKKELHFSESARQELDVITEALTEILDMTVTAFSTNDIILASRVEPLEDVIDHLVKSARMRHIARLKRAECTIEMGFILTDILSNIERISDQCSNIAVCLIETHRNSFDTHSYLHGVKSGFTGDFNEQFERYANKYPLP